MAGHPDNAAANHYLIHLLEAGPNAAEALHSAEILGRLAPGSGHMVHMPGHIYYKLGDHARARDGGEARSIASEPFLASGRPLHAMTLGATSARLAIRFGDWPAAVSHPVEIGDETAAGAPARLYRDGLLAYARGMQAIGEMDFASAGNESNRLDALQWRLNTDAGASKPDAVFTLLETFSLDLRGTLECAQGRTEEGIALLEKAAEKERAVGYGEPPTFSRPESESLGYAWLSASQFAKARQAFEAELNERPHSGHALYGIARSYELAGDRQAAARAYAEFLEAWKEADADLPMVRHARAVVH